MTILPSLTSTRPEGIPDFLEAMGRLGLTAIALFPTCLRPDERQTLYRELERFPLLRIPHVHLRADCGENEIDYLSERFGTDVFNIHPAASTHPCKLPDRLRKRVFVENVDVVPTAEEAAASGGLCPDFAHLENARLWDRGAYVVAECALLARYPVGCCHLSAIRIGDPNGWSAEWDHHRYQDLSDFDYLDSYFHRFPARWASLELENPLEDQLRAAAYIAGRFSLFAA